MAPVAAILLHFLFFPLFIDSKIKKEKILQIRHIILLLASYVFYGWWDWRFCFLMLGLTVVAYASALGMEKYPKKRNVMLVFGVAAPLVV